MIAGFLFLARNLVRAGLGSYGAIDAARQAVSRASGCSYLECSEHHTPTLRERIAEARQGFTEYFQEDVRRTVGGWLPVVDRLTVFALTAVLLAPDLTSSCKA